MKDIAFTLDRIYCARPVMDVINKDPALVFLLLLGEVDEAIAEMNAFLVGTSNQEKVAMELADVVIFVIATLRAILMDPEAVQPYLDLPPVPQAHIDATVTFLSFLDMIDTTTTVMNEYLNEHYEAIFVANTLAHVLQVLCTTFAAIDENPLTHTKRKIRKLELKYPVQLFNKGRTYTQAVQLASQRWKKNGMEAFFS